MKLEYAPYALPRDPITAATKQTHSDGIALRCNRITELKHQTKQHLSGDKDSGFGRFAAVEGLRAYCLVKAVVGD